MRALFPFIMILGLVVGSSCSSRGREGAREEWQTIGDLISKERFAEALSLLEKMRAEKVNLGDTEDEEYAQVLKHSGFCLVRTGNRGEGGKVLNEWIDHCVAKSGECSHATLLARQTVANFRTGSFDVVGVGEVLDPAMKCFSAEQPPSDDVEAMFCIDLASLQLLRGNLPLAEMYTSIALTQLRRTRPDNDAMIVNQEEKLNMIRAGQGQQFVKP